MSRYHSYLTSAGNIISSYEGKEPFSSFLKKYFSAHKKHGSKDRKQISHLCYCYFRMGRAGQQLSAEEKILTGLYLCSDEPGELLSHLRPEWNEKIKLPLREKLSIVNCSLSSVFPWEDELSAGIDYEKFCESFFIQPDLFLRIRPGYAEKVFLKMKQDGVSYEFISPFSVRLPNSFKTDKYFEPDKEVVVQDYSSQQTGSLFQTGQKEKPFRVWDCCAGSGGKSIMLYDLNPSVQLTVSDVRKSILVNLQKRFATAGIKKYELVEADLSSANLHFKKEPFQFIVADVPCSGSGTWSRTPERLVYFSQNEIESYSSLQKRITGNVVSCLEPGGHLLYITCSVFKKENEAVVDYLKEKFHLRVKKMPGRMTGSDGVLVKGYELKADSMFAALLEKPL